MVLVDPKQQVREYGISLVDDSVSVATVFRLVEFRQSAVAVAAGDASVRTWRLVSKVAEKLFAVVNLSVVIAIQGQKRVTRGGCCPSELNRSAVPANVE